VTTNAHSPTANADALPAAITPPTEPPAASGPPGPPDGAAPAFAVLATSARPARYRINETAFNTWCDELGEELETELPEPSAEQPAGRLASFADNAAEAGVIEPVTGLQLDVHGDDSYYDSGFYVMLSNTTGEQRCIYLTSGWNELYYQAEDTDPRESARDYLDTLCAVANTVLDRLHPHPEIDAGV